jgi:hypothetical protein
MGYSAHNDETRDNVTRMRRRRFWLTLQNIIDWACVSMRSMIVILVVAAVPVCAQAQEQSAAKVTERDAQKVVRIISGDKAKTQTHCDMVKLGEQIEQATHKKDTKSVDELSTKLGELGPKLGPEYAALMDGLQDIDPESEEGQEIESALVALDKLCTR